MSLQHGYTRLQEEHTKALNLGREHIKKWQRFKGDYEALQARLATLPEQLTHDVMVPFGGFGFMPGQIYHTNEVMVLLGDNWFAKRTVKQAMEMIGRRIHYVNKMLGEERKQLEEWEARLAFTEEIRTTQHEHEKAVEIKEECGGKEDSSYITGNQGKRVWKARNPKHGKVPPPRAAFPKSPKDPPHERAAPADKPAFADQQEITDKELWQRLDELEREEEVYLAEEKQREEEEREKRGWREEEEEGESGWRPGREEMEEGSGRRWWEDEEEEEEDKEDERKNKASDIKLEKKFQISESAARASDDGGPLRIVVKHCSLIGTGARERSPDMEESERSEGKDEEKEPPLFSSPADIFHKFYHPAKEEERADKEGSDTRVGVDSGAGVERGVRWDPQLVNYQEQPSTGEKEESHVKVTSKRPPLPFSGQVIEHTTPMTTSAFEKPKKVSKFKASRSKGT